MGSWGIKASQIGFDVLEAADYNLTFSSSWPLLKIYSAQSYTINMASSQTILTHNLGFPPMYLVYRVSGGVAEFNSYGLISNGTHNGVIGSNSTSIIYTPQFGGATSCTFFLVVLYNSLELNYTAPTINRTGTSAPIDHNYGIRVTTAGHSTSSTDYRDYVVHSSAVSPMIHSVQNGQLTLTAVPSFAGGTYMESTHDLGYTPLAYCYVKYGTLYGGLYDANTYYMFGGVGGAADFRFLVTSATTSFHYYTNPCPVTATIVTMKDSFTKDNVSVTY